MPQMRWAARGLQCIEQWEPTSKDDGNLEIYAQSELGVATHPHELGIGSNRESSSRGEYDPSLCTHRPSQHASWGWMRPNLSDWIESGLNEWAEVVTR